MSIQHSNGHDYNTDKVLFAKPPRLNVLSILFRFRGPNDEWQLWPTLRVRRQEGPCHDHRLPSDLGRRDSKLKVKRPNKRKQDGFHPDIPRASVVSMLPMRW